MTNDSSPGLWGGLAKKIKDSVWVDAEPKEPVAVPGAIAPRRPNTLTRTSNSQLPVSRPNVVAPCAAASPVAPSDTAPDEVIKVLQGIAMGKQSTYSKFLAALAPLERYIPDEASRYKAAFDVLGSAQTVSQIVRDIEVEHIAAVDAEVKRFQASASGAQQQEISARVQKIEDLQAASQADASELEALRLEMAKRTEALNLKIKRQADQADVLRSEVSSKQADIARKQRQFEAAVVTVRAQLLATRDKVRHYLAD
jgi:hypothetical protein